MFAKRYNKNENCASNQFLNLYISSNYSVYEWSNVCDNCFSSLLNFLGTIYNLSTHFNQVLKEQGQLMHWSNNCFS